MPFIHLHDAAAATVLALGHDGPAIYNITDDEPAPARQIPAAAPASRPRPPQSAPSLRRPITCYDPGRASFTAALQRARGQLIQSARGSYLSQCVGAT
jgi:nucleoside-diphosphate-sugar epimerase